MRIVYWLAFLTFSFSLVSAQTHSLNGNGISYTSLASSLPSAYQRTDSASVGENSRKNDSILNTKKKVKRWEIGVNGGFVYPYKYGGIGEDFPLNYSSAKAIPSTFCSLNLYYRTKKSILFSAGLNYSSSVFSMYQKDYYFVYDQKYYYKYLNAQLLSLYEFKYKNISILPCLGLQFTNLLQGDCISWDTYYSSYRRDVLFKNQGIKLGVISSLTLAYKISDRMKINLAASYSHALQRFRQGYPVGAGDFTTFTLYRVYLPIYYTFSTGLIYSL